MNDKRINRIGINQLSKDGQSVIEVVKKNPRLASGVSKMIAPVRSKRQREVTPNGTINSPEAYGLRSSSDRLIQDQRDAKTLISMMPDIEMSMNVKTAAILNPRDLTTVELTYSPPETKMASILTNGLTDMIRTYFTDVHRITPQLPKILRNAMFLKGGHPIAVIPENTLDALINAPANVSTESLLSTAHQRTVFSRDGSLKTIGLIGPTKSDFDKKHDGAKRPGSLRILTHGTTNVSLESYSVADGAHRALHIYERKTGDVIKDDMVFFHDNPDMLKLPILRQRLAQVSTEHSLFPEADIDPVPETETLSAEAEALSLEFRKVNIDQAESIIYKKHDMRMRNLVIAPTQDEAARVSVSEPLTIDLPYEATFPIFAPGEEDKHVAYIVLIDPETGSFISDRYTDQQLREMSNSGVNSNDSFSSSMISRVNSLINSDASQGGDARSFYQQHMSYCTRVYGELIEADFAMRVFNGKSSQKVSIGNLNDLGRIMLGRRFAEQRTEILFLPKEIVTYFAFAHRRDGVGESLIEQIKPMLAMRLSLMMANLLGELKNSIGRTRVKGTIDEDDGDPMETREKIIEEFIRSRQMFANFPSRVQGPSDIMNYLAGAGIEFSWTEHPRLPDIQLDVEYDSSSHTLPSSDLEDKYQKKTIWKFGVPPELIDSALSPEFAVQSVNSNVMFAKQILQDQLIFAEQLTGHIRQIIKATPSLRGAMIAMVERNMKHIKMDKVTNIEDLSPQVKRELATKLVTQYIDGLTVSLPAPNSVTHRNQLEAMADYEELITKALKYHVNPDFLTEEFVGVNVADRAEMLAASILAVEMRRFMAQHGIAPELSELGIDTDDSNKFTVYDEQMSHARQLMNEFVKLMEKIQDPKEIAESRLVKNTDIADGSSSSSSGSETGSSAPPEGMSDSFGEMPDLGSTTNPEDEPAAGTGEPQPPEEPTDTEDTTKEAPASEQPTDEPPAA